MNPDQDQFKVHRGIPDVVETSTGSDSLGKHWSTNKQVAKRFALGAYLPSDEGTIVHGIVNKKHTLQPDNPEYESVASSLGVLIDNPSAEREVTVKHNSPVLITGKTSVKRRGPKSGVRTRTRTYTPPRKGFI